MAIQVDNKTDSTVKEFWENLYQAKSTAWDIGTFSPPFKTFLDSPYAVPPGRIAVVGCGTGNDCLLFAQYGFEVTGIDFAPSAISATSKKFADAGILGTRGYLLERDIFNIHEYDHYYDYVLENVCFCALHPSLRRKYARTVHDLLKPGGKLIGLWLMLESDNDLPPFALDRNEFFDVFKDLFSIDILHEPTDSVPKRMNKEVFVLMTAK